MLTEPLVRVTKSNYDADHDVLYLFIGHPQFGYEEETYPGIYLRRTEETDEVIGAIIMDYQKRLEGGRKNA